ncbi:MULTISPECIES: alpha/beta hydrolase [Oceanobacillus]|uniref:AB hydrolase superfamily protein YdjP n=1 Tax=Oceanobacillus kimchii TaxID=746691 RepID=A0ABQ5TJX5_9BACI|nr:MULTISPECIES: alpha/beta hydrolase [Oceanobacillus]MBT2599299.1 alpha/beta hydrolase [Oceanobacillus sp. ISL-74]MBT2652217.1 alpha/beta hydrolase [Oceanobacillus sp. ISL-73]MCT1578501.1 alpha/beta hydrolase [Oceanobacillus kimchii]MCT2136450.1 alpha/beta hydrolase [Oceanobacillus kimchii]GLO65440.1 AB hydrolase superfamily protein YdjP [Oceanobacillus kimchii]
MEDFFVEVEENVKLYVSDSGGKENVLVFIPGFTFTSEVFHHQVSFFSNNYRVIVIDPRSHGKSTKTAHGNDYLTHGMDLHKVLQSLRLTNIHLVGWSFGCLTVWEYVKQFGSDNIKSTILIDMPPKSLSVNENDWIEGRLDDMAHVYHASLRDEKGQKEFIKSYSENVMIQRKLTESELDWIIDQSLLTPPYVAASLFASGLFSDYRTEARQLSLEIPTLFVLAEHWSDVAEPYMKQLAPTAKIEVFGGHMMFWEYPEKFNALVKNFLE